MLYNRYAVWTTTIPDCKPVERFVRYPNRDVSDIQSSARGIPGGWLAVACLADNFMMAIMFLIEIILDLSDL